MAGAREATAAEGTGWDGVRMIPRKVITEQKTPEKGGVWLTDKSTVQCTRCGATESNQELEIRCPPQVGGAR